MQIDTPNRTYSPVKPDRGPVTPPTAIKPLKDDKHQRDLPRKTNRPAETNQPISPSDTEENPSFDDFA